MDPVNRYSWLDRLLHRMAFSSPGVQLTAAAIEARLFEHELERLEAGPPVFITSLPRAGTTILLMALNSAPGLATGLYRDMPFAMAPLLWARLSGRFRRQAVPRERAHGDGIAIGYDSPEAFEEVIWRAFWPEHFRPEGIALWSAAEASDEARTFLTRYFRTVVAVRGGDGGRGGRYLSKNNGNMARLDLIAGMFPDADILVPVRRPLAHAASLRRQHANFLRRHAEDRFALRYMRDLGHFEFGELHRPILFENLHALVEGLTPMDLDYWLAYWVAAFEHVAARRARLHLLGYEEMCRDGAKAATVLCEKLGLDGTMGPEIGAHFRAPPPLEAELEAHRSPLRERAEALHAQLVGG